MVSFRCVAFICFLVVLVTSAPFIECASNKRMADGKDALELFRRQCDCEIACCDSAFCCSDCMDAPSWCSSGPCGVCLWLK